MKVSLLSISLVVMSSPAIAGAIPLIDRSFPTQSTTMVEMLTMLPTIMVAIFVLLSIPISKKIGDKNTVLVGLVTALIGGAAPMFVDNFYVLLFFRAVFGAGVGLFNSLCFLLISDFFTGEERTAMLGYQSSFQGGGGAALTFLAGQLLVFGWHAVFSVYLIIIPILALFFFFVPNPPENPQKKNQKTKLCKPFVKYAILNFLIMVLYNAIAIKLPNLYVTKDLGTATAASNVFSIAQIAAMVTGFVYIFIYRICKNYTLPGAIALLGIGFLLIAFSPSTTPIIIGACMVGISFACIVPYLFNLGMDISTPAETALSATLIVVSGQGAGFFAPFVLTALGKIPLLSNQFAQSFFSAAILYLIMAIIVAFMTKNGKLDEKKVSE